MRTGAAGPSSRTTSFPTNRFESHHSEIDPDSFRTRTHQILRCFTRNFTKSGSFVSDTDAVDGRVDYNMNQSTRLFGRYTYLRSVYNAPPIFGTVLGGTGFGPQAEVGGTRTQNLSANLTRVVTSNLVAEVRVGFSDFAATLRRQM